MKIIIAEYSRLLCQCLERLLGADGIKCVGSSQHAEEVLELVNVHTPDVVLVGTLVCGMNRMELIKRLRSNVPMTAILLLTASKEKLAVEAIQAGADAILPEDSSYDDLVQAIRSLHQKEALIHISNVRAIRERFAELSGEAEVEFLSERELELVRLISRGMSTKEVARKLSLSERSVGAYLTRIFTKLDVNSRLEAVVACLARGWLNVEELYG